MTSSSTRVHSLKTNQQHGHFMITLTILESPILNSGGNPVGSGVREQQMVGDMTSLRQQDGESMWE